MTPTYLEVSLALLGAAGALWLVLRGVGSALAWIAGDDDDE